MLGFICLINFFIPRQIMELARMLTGDSLSTASHASPRFATPQTPAFLSDGLSCTNGGFAIGYNGMERE